MASTGVAASQAARNSGITPRSSASTSARLHRLLDNTSYRVVNGPWPSSRHRVPIDRVCSSRADHSSVETARSPALPPRTLRGSAAAGSAKAGAGKPASAGARPPPSRGPTPASFQRSSSARTARHPGNSSHHNTPSPAARP
ncbi:MAG: hypothetical protein IPG93_03320 [Burkholderiales bacterium]|nr:hypothetical protein [Burkholderiales bacterium]